LATITEQRPAETKGRFDFVTSGYTEGGSAQWDQDLIAPMQAAVATWFLEACDPWRFGDEGALARIRRGPPQI
jgi:hypothetical protein